MFNFFNPLSQKVADHCFKINRCVLKSSRLKYKLWLFPKQSQVN